MKKMFVFGPVSFINLIIIVIFPCFLCYCLQTETVRYTTTTSTKQPLIRTPGLSLPQKNVYPPKCSKEVPAVFFQYEKNVLMVGNSSLSPYFNVIEVCCQGYKRYDYDWSRCVPDCGRKCQANGFCLEGGHCQCFNDFILNHRNDCVPICPLGCPYGLCYLNGTCDCRQGYELNPTQKFCMPVCEHGCGRNEFCSSPNECSCEEGYTKLEPDISKMGCQPVCIPDCGYGHCVGPNQCECFHGYQKRANSSVCESNCYMRCENGFCVNRTTCICHDGYKYDQNTTSCLPDCRDDCENGVCIAPGKCRCFTGYRYNGHKCEAICEHGCGFYGKCIAPSICGCSIIEGSYDSYQPCDVGYCNARGRCRCQSGTTRFINKCLAPDQVTTYAALRHQKMNEGLIKEFNLLIGRHFKYPAFDFHNMYFY